LFYDKYFVRIELLTKENVFMKRGSTLILKIILIAIAVLVLVISILTLVMLIRGRVGEYGFILIGMYISIIPFFIALYNAFTLLGYIDKNQAFSISSVKALRKIKVSAAVVSILYAVGLPYIYVIADRDDAPGVIVIGMIIVFGSFVVATFAGVAQKLFQNAVDIKSENDLTV
jgi:hypothetical protein